MDVPHILSNPAERYVVEESAHSVFCIRCCPRGTKFSGNTGAQKAYTKLMTRFVSKKGQRRANTWSALPKVCTNGTGFVYEKPTDCLTILTAAHLIKDAYRDQYSLNNTHLVELNEAYYFEVMCTHMGREVQASGQSADEVEDSKYLPAFAVGIDSEMDLLALKISHAQLSGLCKENHITLDGIARLPPPQGERVLLQAWPENKSDTSVWGIVSSMRGYKWLTGKNPYGYKMDLTEVPELHVEEGCSGGPLVDGRLKCIGVLHGSLDYCGYAVGVPDIRRFLVRSGLMVDTQNAAVAAAAGTDQVSKYDHEQAVGKGPQQLHKDISECTMKKRAGKKKAQEEDGDENDDEDEEWTAKRDDNQRGRGRGRGRGRVGRGPRR